MCHAGTEPIIERLTPFWALMGQPLIFVSPVDSRVKTPHVNVYIGGNGHHVPGSGERLDWILGTTVAGPDQSCYIFEYDSFCIRKPEIKGKGLYGITFKCGPYDILAQRYAIHPWILDRDSALKILVKARKYPFMGDWFMDRMMCGWAQLAGVPLIGTYGQAYGCREITEVKLKHIERLYETHRLNWFHGIKNAAIVDAILNLDKQCKVP